MPVEIIPARVEHRPALCVLLQQAGLPAEDLPETLTHFLLAIDSAAQVIGSAGWELYGAAGLLRSFAVAPEHRSTGLGQRLYEAAIAHAASQGVQEAWLITTSAADYFAKRGFERVARDEAPDQIQNTAQFSGLCPASATLMKRSL